LPPGDFALPREALPLLITQPGLVLTSSAGPEATRLRAVGAREDEQRSGSQLTPAGARETDVLIFVAASGVTIRGLTLSSAVYNIYAGAVADCEISGNRFDFSKRYHVCLYDGRGHRLTGNTSRAALNNAFKLESCHDCVIAHNTFHEDPAALRLTASCGNEIARNRFLEISWHGLMLEDGSHGNRIVGNLFSDGRLTGVQVRGSDRTEIVGNEFRGQKTEAVLVDRGSREVRLRGNSFHDNHGLAVSNETPHWVDAIYNCWGSPRGPGPGAEVDAKVLYDPWLAEPPPADL
jgi:parallel beta-helix repeat protein